MLSDLKQSYKIFFSWLAVILWACVIFTFSSQNGTESGGLSSRVLQMFVLPVLNFLHIYNADPVLLSFLIRKAAHMFIYFVLAILSCNAVNVTRFTFLQGKSFLPRVCVLIFCFLYAATDEFHQSLTPERGPAFTDVLIDTSGALIGILIFSMIAAIIKHCKDNAVSE